MKTIKEIEKDLMQQDMQKILNKYHNGVYEKEARILQARQNAEASVPFREKYIRYIQGLPWCFVEKQEKDRMTGGKPLPLRKKRTYLSAP